jgi:hypothetical protein
MHGAESLLNPDQLENRRHPAQSPVGWSWKSHSRSNRSARCDAIA